MKFGCYGTIVGVTAAILDAVGGQNPEVQIWRENETQPGLYHRISSTNNLIRWNNNRCYRRILSRGIYYCYALRENYRIPVQPGDFLGLELPPINEDDPVIYFKAGGPTNLVFQYPLNSTVDRSTEPHNITYDEPQVTFLVFLGKIMMVSYIYGNSINVNFLKMKVQIHALPMFYLQGQRQLPHILPL